MTGGTLLRERVLFRADEEGRSITALVPSPDRSRIAYLLAPAGAEEGELWVFARDTGARRPLGHLDHGYWSPAWTPDGAALIAISSRCGGGDLWHLPSAGGPHRRLTALGGNVACAAPAPEGDRIALLADRGDGVRIWLVSPTGDSPQRLSELVLSRDPARRSGRGAGAALAWSPDGRRIAVSTSLRADEGAWLTRILLIDAASGRDAPLFERTAQTAEECALLDLSFSPDGKALAFRRRIGTKDHLLVISLNGRRLLKRKYIGSLADSPWSPDGSCVACASEPGLLEIHDLRRGSVGTLRQDGGLHRFRAPRFDGPDTLLYARGPSIALLPVPAPGTERSFVLDADPPPPSRVEAEHRDTTTRRLASARGRLSGNGPTPAAQDPPREEAGGDRSVAAGPTLASPVESPVGGPGLAVGPAAASPGPGARPDPADLRLAASHAALVPLAITHLGSLPPSERESALLELLADEDPTTFDTVLAAVEVPGTECGDALCAALVRRLDGSGPVGPGTRGAVLRLLADRGAAGHETRFEAAAGCDDELVRAAGVYALLRTHPERTDLLATLRPAAREAWVDFGAPEPDDLGGRRYLWPHLAGGRAWGDPVFLEAIRALRRSGTPLPGAALERLLVHADAAVRAWSLHSVGPDAEDATWDRVRERLRDPAASVRSAAVAALARRSGTTLPLSGLSADLRAELRRDSRDERRYWHLRLHGVVRTDALACAGATFSFEVDDRCEILELGPLPARESAAVDRSFSLGLWVAIPEALAILIETFEGARDVQRVALVHLG